MDNNKTVTPGNTDTPAPKPMLTPDEAVAMVAKFATACRSPIRRTSRSRDAGVRRRSILRSLRLRSPLQASSSR